MQNRPSMRSWSAPAPLPRSTRTSPSRRLPSPPLRRRPPKTRRAPRLRPRTKSRCEFRMRNRRSPAMTHLQPDLSLTPTDPVGSDDDLTEDIPSRPRLLLPYWVYAHARLEPVPPPLLSTARG
jgi:hypothetical protein